MSQKHKHLIAWCEYLVSSKFVVIIISSSSSSSSSTSNSSSSSGSRSIGKS